MMELSWQKAVEKAEALKALGQTEVYLFDSANSDYPWFCAEECEPGGTHRMDIATSVRFIGAHPCGLTFKWTWDLEPRCADGQGHFIIDRQGAMDVLAKLPLDASESFRKYLAVCAEAVQAKGDEWQKIATKQFQDAHLLRTLAQIQAVQS